MLKNLNDNDIQNLINYPYAIVDVINEYKKKIKKNNNKNLVSSNPRNFRLNRTKTTNYNYKNLNFTKNIGFNIENKDKLNNNIFVRRNASIDINILNNEDLNDTLEEYLLSPVDSFSK